MKARVKETIELAEGQPGMLREMLEYRGQIIEVRPHSNHTDWYVDQGGGWTWREDWLDFLPEATQAEHEAVDKTIIAWKTLAADPKLTKNDILDMLPDTHQECWLCVPWLNVSANCLGCPLSGEGFNCETKDQPYIVWKHSKGTTRQIAALQLIKQCEDWKEAHPLKPELVIKVGHVYRIEGIYYELISVGDGYTLACLKNTFIWSEWADTKEGAFGWALDKAEHIGPASEVVKVEEKGEE